MFKLNILEFLNFFLFFPSYCKKPLTSNCTIQIATPGNDGDSTPKPVPILAAAFCTDKQSLLLVYGNNLQPIIEKVVCRTYQRGFGFCNMDCILLSVGESFGFIIFVFTALELYNSTKHIPCPCFGSCDSYPGAVWKGDLYSSFFQLEYRLTSLLTVSCHFSCC